MPRRDGFPTNNELQDQFEVAGTQLFIAAFQHDLDSKMPDYLKDKPLAHVALKMVEMVTVPQGLEQTTAVFGNQLDLRPADRNDAFYYFEDHLRWRGNEVKRDRVAFAAQIIGETILNDEAHIDDLPPEGIVTDFTAHMLNTTHTRHVSTHKEKPTKMSLVAGLAALETARAYVDSADFERSVELRMLDKALFGVTSEFDKIFHKWDIPFRIDLVFNGHESPKYLTGYIEYAQHNIESYERMLERSISAQAPQIMIDHNGWRLDMWRQAKDRAKQAFERSGQ